MQRRRPQQQQQQQQQQQRPQCLQQQEPALLQEQEPALLQEQQQEGRKQQQKQEQHDWVQPGPSPICLLTLRLRSRQLERQCWQTPPARRMCCFFDSVALYWTLANHCLLIASHVFAGRSMQMLLQAHALFTLPLVLLPLASLVQLWCRGRWPTAHQRHRLAVAVANRLVRLATVVAQAVVWPQHAWACSAPAASAANTHFSLLRFLIAPHLIFLHHAHFFSPFPVHCFFQVGTLTAQLLMITRLCICQNVAQPQLQQQAVAACKGVRRAMVLIAGFLAGGLPLVSNCHEEAACSGVAAVALLQTCSVVSLLLVLPLSVLFFLELNLKVNFLRSCSREACGSAQVIPPLAALLADSRTARALVVVVALVLSYFVCEALVAAAGPLSCNVQQEVIRGRAVSPAL